MEAPRRLGALAAAASVPTVRPPLPGPGRSLPRLPPYPAPPSRWPRGPSGHRPQALRALLLRQRRPSAGAADEIPSPAGSRPANGHAHGCSPTQALPRKCGGADSPSPALATPAPAGLRSSPAPQPLASPSHGFAPYSSPTPPPRNRPPKSPSSGGALRQSRRRFLRRIPTPTRAHPRIGGRRSDHRRHPQRRASRTSRSGLGAPAPLGFRLDAAPKPTLILLAGRAVLPAFPPGGPRPWTRPTKRSRRIRS